MWHPGALEKIRNKVYVQFILANDPVPCLAAHWISELLIEFDSISCSENIHCFFLTTIETKWSCKGSIFYFEVWNSKNMYQRWNLRKIRVFMYVKFSILDSIIKFCIFKYYFGYKCWNWRPLSLKSQESQNMNLKTLFTGYQSNSQWRK